MNQIQINNVTKQFGDTTALSNVSLTFEPEKIYGLLGRNGAGKSTLLNIITNREFPSTGNVTIDGEPAMENDFAQDKLYLMSEQELYAKDFKVKDIFRWTEVFYGQRFDMDTALELSELFELDLNKKITKLSTGYKSVYKNIVALSLKVPYLFLDEPVLGLDANFRDLFYQQLLKTYTERPRTIVISTHLIEEVSRIIEHVIMINRGKIIENTTVEEMLSYAFTVSGSIQAVDKFCMGKPKIGEEQIGSVKHAYLYGKLNKEGAEGVKIAAMDLQKLFVMLTNKK